MRQPIEKSLRQRALEYLSKREYSAAELAQKLKGYAEEADDVAALIEDFKTRGWLSDARYAEQMVQIAMSGLKNRSRLSPAGEDETHFLEPLVRIVESGETPAEALLKLYNGRWNKSVDPAFTELAY